MIDVGRMAATEQQHALADELRTRGYALIDLTDFCGENDLPLVVAWQETFTSAFALPDEAKRAGGVFRFEKGMSVGYKTEDAREFFETRLVDGGAAGVEPDYSHQVAVYGATVRALYTLLRRAAHVVVSACAASLGLDPRCLLELTDLDDPVVSPPPDGEIPPDTATACDAAPGPSPSSTVPPPLPLPMHSPSLLRVCKYPDGGGPTERVVDDEAFGAHTDTSFVTIGLRAARPGLQVLPLDALSHPDSDHRRHQWVDVEETSDDRVSPAALTGPVVAVVLVGECLQVLTGGHFRAAPHRVVAGLPSHVHHDSSSGTSSGTSSGSRSGGGRVSCPFIVRGRPDAVVGLRDPHRGYHHTCAPELLEESEPSPDEGSKRPFRLPNLDGSSMRFLHRLLEMKRRRCARAHTDTPDTNGADGSGAGDGTDWILCAYPMEPAAAADSSNSRREAVD